MNYIPCSDCGWYIGKLKNLNIFRLVIYIDAWCIVKDSGVVAHDTWFAEAPYHFTLLTGIIKSPAFFNHVVYTIIVKVCYEYANDVYSSASVQPVKLSFHDTTAYRL
jgi:hypothetical protein